MYLISRSGGPTQGTLQMKASPFLMDSVQVLFVDSIYAACHREQSSHLTPSKRILLSVNLANIFVWRNTNTSQECSHDRLVSFCNCCNLKNHLEWIHSDLAVGRFRTIFWHFALPCLESPIFQEGISCGYILDCNGDLVNPIGVSILGTNVCFPGGKWGQASSLHPQEHTKITSCLSSPPVKLHLG